MPRSAKPTDYGPEYTQLLNRISAAHRRLTLSFPTPKLALSMKSKFYAYRNALRVSRTSETLLAIAESVAAHTDGSTLHFFPKEDSWDAVLLREALALPEGFSDDPKFAAVLPDNPANLPGGHPLTQVDALASLQERLAAIRARRASEVSQKSRK